MQTNNRVGFDAVSFEFERMPDIMSSSPARAMRATLSAFDFSRREGASKRCMASLQFSSCREEKVLGYEGLMDYEAQT
jgi:hypothetical protein